MNPNPEQPIKPPSCKDDHLEFLDELRESGRTNMFGARPYLRRKFRRLSEGDAKAILVYWMQSFEERHVAQLKRATAGGGTTDAAATMNLPIPHRQEMLWLDATPDEGYPLRILKAYRDNCDCRMVTNPPQMGEMMNRWQDERASILDRAIAILSSAPPATHEPD